MPPRLYIIRATRSLAIRMRPIAPRQPRIAKIASRRCFANGQTPATGGSESGIGHVNEEAVDMGNITGGTTPDLNQGTPVQEILERDGDMDIAPGIIKEKSSSQDGVKTAVSAQSADEMTFQHLMALGQMENIAAGGTGYDPVDIDNVGHKFDLPMLPLGKDMHMKFRYDPVVTQVTNLMMVHGKKSVAQRNMAYILNHLRISPPPTLNPSRPLLAGAPPANQLPLDPIAYLTLAIDSIAPLVRIRQQKGAAGGGAALQIPVPLGARQRRRTAMQWILDAASKKRSKGSGKDQFAQRVAEELIGVVEGRSAAWDKRTSVHKLGTQARANLNKSGGKRKF